MRDSIQDLRRRISRRQRKLRGPRQEFGCPVVNETVVIRLRRAIGFGRATGNGGSGFFVECNQMDCQYREANEPPCPLHVEMFAADVEARKVDSA